MCFPSSDWSSFVMYWGLPPTVNQVLGLKLRRSYPHTCRHIHYQAEHRWEKYFCSFFVVFFLPVSLVTGTGRGRAASAALCKEIKKEITHTLRTGDNFLCSLLVVFVLLPLFSKLSGSKRTLVCFSVLLV